jgi:hypothetical protein
MCVVVGSTVGISDAVRVMRQGRHQQMHWMQFTDVLLD